MKLWRIARSTRSYGPEDLSGAGAAKEPGRWNDKTESVLYAAMTLSLAVLETAAHINDHGFPLDRFVVELDVPDVVWAQREAVSLSALPPHWAAIPSGMASARVGSAWLASLRSPILLVPSVIVPEEFAVLINPAHPASAAVSAKVLRQFRYDVVFRPK